MNCSRIEDGSAPQLLPLRSALPRIAPHSFHHYLSVQNTYLKNQHVWRCSIRHWLRCGQRCHQDKEREHSRHHRGERIRTRGAFLPTVSINVMLGCCVLTSGQDTGPVEHMRKTKSWPQMACPAGWCRAAGERPAERYNTTTLQSIECHHSSPCGNLLQPQACECALQPAALQSTSTTPNSNSAGTNYQALHAHEPSCFC